MPFLVKDRDPRCRLPGLDRHQTELPCPGGRPTALLLRRFADQQDATELKKGSSALGRHRRAGKGSGDHPGVPAAVGGVPSHVLRPARHRRHPVGQPKADARRHQERRLGSAGVEQDPPRAWSITGQDQTRDPSAAPEIEGEGVSRGAPVAEEGPGVGDLGFDRSRAKIAPLAGLFEDLDQRIVGARARGRWVGVSQRGRPPGSEPDAGGPRPRIGWTPRPGC